MDFSYVLRRARNRDGITLLDDDEGATSRVRHRTRARGLDDHDGVVITDHRMSPRR